MYLTVHEQIRWDNLTGWTPAATTASIVTKNNRRKSLCHASAAGNQIRVPGISYAPSEKREMPGEPGDLEDTGTNAYRQGIQGTETAAPQSSSAKHGQLCHLPAAILSAQIKQHTVEIILKTKRGLKPSQNGFDYPTLKTE